MAQDVDIELRFKLLEDVNKKVDKLGEAFDQLEKKRFRRLSGFFTKLSIGVTGINQGLELLSKGFDLANKAITPFIQNASKIEDLEQQFATLTGSIQNASSLLKDLQAFSARTPFQLEGLAQASRQLLSFGFGQEEVIDRLQQLGDVAAASGTELTELSLIFGQVQAAGKLTGERLLQFQERAVPIGPAIAETMGVAESAVKDLVSQGAVTFDVFDKAFKSLTESGGQFANGMARQSQTLSGRISTLKDNFVLLQAEIGKNLLPIVKQVVSATTEYIQKNKELLKSKAIEFFKGMTRAASITLKVLFGIKQVFSLFPLLFKGLLSGILKVVRGALGYFQEINKLIRGFGGEGFGFKAINNTIEELNGVISESEKDIVESFNEIFDSSDVLLDAADKVEKLTESIGKLGGSGAGGDKKIIPKIDVSGPDSFLGQLQKFALGLKDNIIGGLKKGADALQAALKDKSVTQVLGGLSSSIAGGRGGAQALGANALTTAFGPGAGEIFKLFSMPTEEFRKALDGFIDFFVELPGILAENAAYFIERIVDRTPEIINAFIDAIPIIVSRLAELLTDPDFWFRVAQTQAEAFLSILTFGIVDSLKPLTDAVQPFADAVNSFVGTIDKLTSGGGAGGFLKNSLIGGFVGGGVGSVIGGARSVFGLANGGDVPNLSRYSNDGFGPVMLDQDERVLTGSTGQRLDRFLEKMETGGSSQSELIEAIKALNITLIANDVEIAKSVNRAVNDGFIIGRRG